MANRNYLVAYDISDPRRLRRVFRAMRGYGVAWQKSVFYCHLGPAKRQRMETRLRELVHHSLDQIVIMDLGPRQNAVQKACQVIGRPLPANFPKIVII